MKPEDKSQVNDAPTPKTDAKASPHIGFYSCATVPADFARKLERERDEALEKIKQQKLEIVRLNGATNHAGGTPLKIALRERDEANEELNKKYIEYDKLFDEAELIRIERDQILQALMKIEEIFIDGEDTYDDWLAMGKIARATLERLNQQ